MKRLKQTFAQRYNRAEGRIGHIWGDRYGSWIVEGEPVGEESGISDIGVRPYYEERAVHPPCPPLFPLPIAPVPG
jgi:hypothetical protein